LSGVANNPGCRKLVALFALLALPICAPAVAEGQLPDVPEMEEAAVFQPEAGAVPIAPQWSGEEASAVMPRAETYLQDVPPGQAFSGGMVHRFYGETWSRRPLSAGLFVGMIQGGPLIDGRMGMKLGPYGGVRMGLDTSDHWGGELRFAFGSAELYESGRSHPVENPRSADVYQWDFDLLYYPCGDSRWRPYFLVGAGSARVDFTDHRRVHRQKAVFALPVAIGLKYLHNSRFALRFECANNIIFGVSGGYNTLHALSVTGGVEFRFGGPGKSYWPYVPGRRCW